MSKPLNPGILLRSALLLGVVGAAIYLRGDPLFQFETWLELVRHHRNSAPFLFVVIYAAAVAFLLPTLPLNLAAGALWGPFWGSMLALGGSVSGALLAFVVARATIGQALAGRMNGALLPWLNGAIVKHGWKVVAFVRLNPLFPGPVNFLFGLTSIRFWTYAWASILFLIPPTVVFTLVGYSAGNVLLHRSLWELRVVIVLTGALITAFVLMSVIARRKITRYGIDAEQNRHSHLKLLAMRGKQIDAK